MAEAEGRGKSSSSCPCGRCWRLSRDSSGLHALSRLPDRSASRRPACLIAAPPTGVDPGGDHQKDASAAAREGELLPASREQLLSP